MPNILITLNPIGMDTSRDCLTIPSPAGHLAVGLAKATPISTISRETTSEGTTLQVSNNPRRRRGPTSPAKCGDHPFTSWLGIAQPV